jgi:hypothetical protein
MKDFLASIGSLYWWLSVVVVGVLINISSAYLKSKLDSSLSRISTKWRLRSEVQKALRRKHFEKLRGNPAEQMMISMSELRDRIRSIEFLVLARIIHER